MKMESIDIKENSIFNDVSKPNIRHYIDISLICVLTATLISGKNHKGGIPVSPKVKSAEFVSVSYTGCS